MLGSCTFPIAMPADDNLTTTFDGCMIRLGTLPGGDFQHYNEGMTSVHEVGHWFGLLHVFEGLDCAGQGDLVADTPSQILASKGCNTTQDSCPDFAGLDNVHNYMDYSYDAW